MPFPFLLLPAELRQKVYRHLFCSRSGYAVARMIFEPQYGTLWQFWKESVGDYTPLFRSCRQVYHEAATVLYGENTFVFTEFTLDDSIGYANDSEGGMQCEDIRNCDITPMSKWLHGIGDHNRLLLRSLKLYTMFPYEIFYSSEQWLWEFKKDEEREQDPWFCPKVIDFEEFYSGLVNGTSDFDMPVRASILTINCH